MGFITAMACCHCCGSGSIHGLGISACHRCGQKKKQTNKKKKQRVLQNGEVAGELRGIQERGYWKMIQWRWSGLRLTFIIRIEKKTIENVLGGNQGVSAVSLIKMKNDKRHLA